MKTRPKCGKYCTRNRYFAFAVETKLTGDARRITVGMLETARIARKGSPLGWTDKDRMATRKR